MNFEVPHEEILSCMSEAVYVIDRDMTIRYVNPAAEKLSGFAAAESLNNKCHNIFCEASYLCNELCPPKTAMREKKPILHREAKTKTKNGEMRHTQISFSPFFKGDESIGAVIVVKDITEVKKAEERVLRQNKFMKLVIDSLPHPFYVVDADDYTIKIANRAAAPGGLKDGPTCHALTHGMAQPCLENGHPCPLLEVKRTKKPVVVEHLHYNDKGELSCFEVHGNPIFNDQEEVIQMIEYSFDVSERKKLEEERLKSHMLESVGILASGIAHDFNNLLTVIVGHIGMVKMRVKPDDKAFQQLTDAELSCTIAGELSHRLLTFSTGGEPVKKVMSLSGFLVDVIGAALRGSTTVPEFDLPDSLHPVSIDERQMKQVVNNLVLNAKESMPLGGKLIVTGKNLHVSDHDATLTKTGGYVMISFRDTGVGIPSEDLAKIFDPYFSTKDTFGEKGMGLGLAVCYSIIKRHDGLITVESEYGKGATFHMYLPAAG